MLSVHEKAKIDEEIAKFPQKKNACLDALMVVQKTRGYVSDDALLAVADYLEMSATELDGIATFYNLIFRKPVGNSVIRLCDSVSCWIMGYEEIKARIKQEHDIDFGETSADKNFTLLPAQCLGACDRAPVMMIDDKLYCHLKKDTVCTILLSHKPEGHSHDATAHRTHETERSASQLERI